MKQCTCTVKKRIESYSTRNSAEDWQNTKLKHTAIKRTPEGLVWTPLKCLSDPSNFHSFICAIKP